VARVLIITSSQKRTGFIWVLLLAMLVLAPMVWLNHLITELRKKDEIYLDMQARERLLNEMASFQERLKAENHIEAALEDMRKEFGINIDNDNYRNLSFTYATDPMLIQSHFPASASEFLRQNYHITPLLAFAVDCDMQNFYSFYSKNLFADEKERESFESAAAYWMVFSQHDVVNELSTTPDLQKKNEAYKNSGNDGYENTQQRFSDLLQTHVSAFATPPTASSICRVFFSNRFGAQRSFQIVNQITRPRGLRVSMLGCYYFVFNSCDMSPAMVMKTALTHVDPGIERFIFKKSIEQPQFVYNDNYLNYYSAFPAHYSTLIEDYAITDPETSKDLREFLNTHALCVRIASSNLKSSYSAAEGINGALTRALILVFFALLIRSFMHELDYGMRLARKLRIAVTVIVMLPVIGVFLFSRQYEANDEKMNQIKCQTQIRRQLDFLAKLIADTDARILLMLQESKKFLIYRHYRLNDELGKDIWKEGHFRRVTSGILEGSLTRDGHSIITSRRRNTELTSIETGLYQILLDLGATNPESNAIKKIHKKYTILIGLAGALTNLFSEPEALARESLINKHILSASALIRSVHHFIVNPQNPKVIDAIALFMVDDINIIKKLYAQLSQLSLHLFSEYDENCQIDYAMAMRSPSSIRTYQAPNFSAPSNRMARMAALAMNNKTSGTIIRRSHEQINIDSWTISDLNPVIILARATISRNKPTHLMFAILPWALLIYSILAVALISDVLADIFLAPVKTLLKFVGCLKNNDLQIKTAIPLGGEFEELGNSFNQMVEGLRQREKMQRFVSDKLVASLEKQGEAHQPTRAALSVLSSDIRGFTALSEQYPPEEIVSLLNDYFTCMEEALQKFGGSIEKIVGDAITAAFYDDAEQECYAIRACKAAREMKARLSLFNRERQKKNKFTILNGIGIASGEAVLGLAAGGSGRREFVLIGEVTHRAEKLETQTRWGKSTGIFVDQATADLLSEETAKVCITSEEVQSICLELTNV